MCDWLRVSPPGIRKEGAVATRISLLLTIGTAMLFACAGIALAQTTQPDPAQGEERTASTSSLDAGEVIPNRYIVALDKDVARPRSVASDLSEQLDFETTYVYDDALEGFAAEMPPGEDLSALRSDPRVDFVAKDRVLEASRQVRPTGIKRVGAPQSSTAAGNGSGRVNADIAILDSGIYKKHRDLNIAGGHNCVGKDRRAWSDGFGHGTHVAGTAAAKDNAIGVVGVAPGARLWAVKVLNDRGVGSISSTICGIDWVTGKDANGDGSSDIEVANMSLSGTVPGSEANNCGWRDDGAAARMHQAICNSVDAGVFYAVAAGNQSKNFATVVPAAFDQVLTVTAMADFNGKPGGGAGTDCQRNQADTFAGFSNRTTVGSPDASHTIAAPGVCIISTWNDGDYKRATGTSTASPHVAGTAALYMARHPAATPRQVMNQLLATAKARPASYGYKGDPRHPTGNRYYGYLEYAGAY
jgi:subtilisin